MAQRATTPSTRPAALPFLLRSVIGLRSSSMGMSSRGSTSRALPMKSSAPSLAGFGFGFGLGLGLGLGFGIGIEIGFGFGFG